MSEEKYRKLFIGGLDPNVEEIELMEYFSRYGQVEDCVVLRDKASGRHRGFGFVAFTDPATVDAVQAARPHAFRGREVQLKRAVPKEQFECLDGHLTVSKLFVGGIGDQIESDQLREYFNQYGSVRRVDIIEDRQTGQRRGFAFIEFNDYDPVDKVVLRGPHTVNGRNVDVRKAMTRYEMSLLREKKKYDRRGNSMSVPRLSPVWRRNPFPFLQRLPAFDIFGIPEYAMPWNRSVAI